MRGSVGPAFGAPFDAPVHKAVISAHNNSGLSTALGRSALFVLCWRRNKQRCGPQPSTLGKFMLHKNKRRLSTGLGGLYHDDHS
jgi:hypothetical protein